MDGLKSLEARRWELQQLASIQYARAARASIEPLSFVQDAVAIPPLKSEKEPRNAQRVNGR